MEEVPCVPLAHPLRTLPYASLREQMELFSFLRPGGITSVVWWNFLPVIFWETDFDTPPVLGGAALFDNSAPVDDHHQY